MPQLRGGAAIGAGSFGCVFRPNLITDQSRAQSADFVSKLMTPSDATAELAKVESLKLDAIDPEGDFTVYPSKQVETGVQFQKGKQAVKKNGQVVQKARIGDEAGMRTLCPNAQKEIELSKDVKQYLAARVVLKSPYGGRSIGSLLTNEFRVLNNTDFQPLNTSLIRLLQNGLNRLHAENVVHFDVKADNVVITLKNVSKLIDWGWAFSTSREDWWQAPQMLRQLVNFNLPMCIPLVRAVQQVTIRVDPRTPWKPAVAALLVGCCLKDFVSEDGRRDGRRDGALVLNTVENLLAPVIGTTNTDLLYPQRYTLNCFQYAFDAFKRVPTRRWPSTPAGKAFSGVKNSVLGGILLKQMFMVVDRYASADAQGRVTVDVGGYFNEVVKPNVDVYGLMSIYAQMVPCLSRANADASLLTALRALVYDTMFSAYYAARPYNVSDIIQKLQQLNTLATTHHTLLVPADAGLTFTLNSQVVDALQSVTMVQRSASSGRGRS